MVLGCRTRSWKTTRLYGGLWHRFGARGGGGDMATSKCGHCGEGLFELKTIEPGGGTYKVNMVQCSTCGAVVGAVYDFNAGVMLQLQEKKIDDIAELIGRIDAGLRAVVAALNRL